MEGKKLLSTIYILSLQLEEGFRKENQEVIDNCIDENKQEIYPDYFIESLKELNNHKFDFKSYIDRNSDLDKEMVDQLSRAFYYLSTFTLFTLINGKVVVTHGVAY